MQDVNDVLTAIDHVISLELAYPSRIAVYGGSHGGFLSTHLIGQVRCRFECPWLHDLNVINEKLCVAGA